MPQNKNLTDERLAQIQKSLKRWADHDNTLNSYISGTKIDPIFHDCVIALAELQELRKAGMLRNALPATPDEEWVERYCELMNRHPDGEMTTYIVDSAVTSTFREVSRREIGLMLAAAPAELQEKQQKLGAEK
ncbi:hypothetical protein ACI08L_000828 [Cronobacter sakazakii]|uniref:hypothetical protein n=1 Tax=Klebsiella pneumoniae TaxID=573 RepID=UPI0027EE3851|nr:hypothetical protein [Salmonella enterica]HDU5029337.1 hypothetical protein [Klebsiella pneumoniae subsp. pneumoniae]